MFQDNIRNAQVAQPAARGPDPARQRVLPGPRSKLKQHRKLAREQ